MLKSLNEGIGRAALFGCRMCHETASQKRLPKPQPEEQTVDVTLRKAGQDLPSNSGRGLSPKQPKQQLRNRFTANDTSSYKTEQK